MTTIELTDEDAKLFIEFQKRYEIVGYIVGYLDALKVFDMKNMSVKIDIDQNGIVQHCEISRHYRK